MSEALAARSRELHLSRRRPEYQLCGVADRVAAAMRKRVLKAAHSYCAPSAVACACMEPAAAASQGLPWRACMSSLGSR